MARFTSSRGIIEPNAPAVRAEILIQKPGEVLLAVAHDGTTIYVALSVPEAIDMGVQCIGAASTSEQMLDAQKDNGAAAKVVQLRQAPGPVKRG